MYKLLNIKIGEGNGTKRQSNFELLRIVSMLLVLGTLCTHTRKPYGGKFISKLTCHIMYNRTSFSIHCLRKLLCADFRILGDAVKHKVVCKLSVSDHFLERSKCANCIRIRI